jgi:hypothetical protein
MARKDARTGTAIHEAGHVVAARQKGATDVTARVDTVGSRSRGSYSATFGGSKRDEAVIALAGAAAARRLAGRGYEVDRSDTRQARRLLKGSGVSLRQARREARAVVRANRREIEREAKRLLKRGKHK